MIASIYLTMTFKLPEEEKDAEVFEKQNNSSSGWLKLECSSAITYEFRTTKFVPTSGMPFETE